MMLVLMVVVLVVVLARDRQLAHVVLAIAARPNILQPFVPGAMYILTLCAERIPPVHNLDALVTEPARVRFLRTRVRTRVRRSLTVRAQACSWPGIAPHAARRPKLGNVRLVVGRRRIGPLRLVLWAGRV